MTCPVGQGFYYCTLSRGQQGFDSPTGNHKNAPQIRILRGFFFFSPVFVFPAKWRDSGERRHIF